ncbi:MAG: long-chain fatty acid--CoA ligase [Chloroflexi bacterium]|nr:MAG: long-chain fatty acid--CoA ligase [Chloroflexota bacterium]
MHGLMMDYPLTLDRILEHANRLYPHKRVTTKLPNGSLHQYTYADLYRRVKRLGNVLESLGVDVGDRVGTFAWNHYQHLELYFGIPGAGAVCHTLNIRLPPDQLAYIINHAEDRVIFVDGTLLPLFERLAGQIDGVEQIVLFNAERGVTTSFPNALFYEELMAAASDDYTWRSTDERLAMGLCYTSGTTGNPKGALYSHRSMYLHTLGVCQSNSLAVTEADVVLPVVPQFHAMAWGLPFACVMNGADMIMPGPHLQAAPLADLIAEHRVTVAAGVPTIWTGLYHELKANPRDISCIRALVVGGAAMPRSLIEGYEKELGVNVCHAWGMTEMSPLGTISRLQGQHRDLPDHEKWDIKARQGYPIAGVEMRIVNDLGDELPWDGATMGEVQVRGPWVIKQYFRVEPTPDQFTADGWFRTGDVATISPDGYMNITDRTKDLIKSGGEWISSVALENALMAHPNVMEAVVIAVPDAKWGERPLAAVVPAPGVDGVPEAELLDYLSAHFAKYQLPDKIVTISAIPKTSVGKFDKKVLRQQYAEGKLT